MIRPILTADIHVLIVMKFATSCCINLLSEMSFVGDPVFVNCQDSNHESEQPSPDSQSNLLSALSRFTNRTEQLEQASLNRIGVRRQSNVL